MMKEGIPFDQLDIILGIQEGHKCNASGAMLLFRIQNPSPVETSTENSTPMARPF